jgi:O-antigen/teichoic acid export membrane protein
VLPAGHAVSLQGFTIVIGVALGPVAVTSFSTLRTLTRVTLQFLTTIVHTIWPELSSAFGTGDLALARTLHRNSYRAGLAGAFLLSLFLWIAGPTLYRMWMRHTVPFNSQCFHILLLVTVANSLWFLSSVVPMSTNAHHRIALIYFGFTIVSLAIAYVSANSLGIAGPALALLLIDVGMCWIVMRTTLSQLNERFTDFIAGLLYISPGQWNSSSKSETSKQTSTAA